MAKTGDIKRRIRSVGNIQKITKAMEMVAAVKMRRAVEAVLKTRTYANLSWETMVNVARLSRSRHEPIHPLLVRRPRVSRVGIVLIASNRGLCGGFNAALLQRVRHSIAKHQRTADGEIESEFIVVGKKGELISRWGYKIAAEFPKTDLARGIVDILPIARLVTEDFLFRRYDKIMVAYTDYFNPLQQKPRVRQLLPVEIEAPDRYLGVVGKGTAMATSLDFIEDKAAKHLVKDELAREYLFEPAPFEVLDQLLPRLIEVQLYQALLEVNASEHSARMSAMRQANESAAEMVDDLTLFYNKTRQAGITAEIAEIAAGANALE